MAAVRRARPRSPPPAPGPGRVGSGNPGGRPVGGRAIHQVAHLLLCGRWKGTQAADASRRSSGSAGPPSRSPTGGVGASPTWAKPPVLLRGLLHHCPNPPDRKPGRWALLHALQRRGRDQFVCIGFGTHRLSLLACLRRFPLQWARTDHAEVPETIQSTLSVCMR